MDTNQFRTNFEVNTWELASGHFERLVYERNYTHNIAEKWFYEGEVKDYLNLLDDSVAACHRDECIWATMHYAEGEALALINIGRSGSISANVAGHDVSTIREAIERIKLIIPEAEAPADDLTYINFWTNGARGPSSVRRKISVPTWDEISTNYASDIAQSLEKVNVSQPENFTDGQLILWQGLPGTGKTYALRALARSWREWAECHYIVDPDQFFGGSSDYMMQVLLSSTSDHDEYGEEREPKWKLLILEDCGELLAEDAKSRTGQALSRLLNVVDGLIGQGLRIMILVTTNEELNKLHPAVTRPGRCASQLEFDALDIEAVKKWAEQNEVELDENEIKSHTLANLYALKSGKDTVDINTSKPQAVGFC